VAIAAILLEIGHDQFPVRSHHLIYDTK
jgi:hypothetical protein